MAAPTITLTARLQDICGNNAGSTANPASLRIALAPGSFGATLPTIAGTSVLAEVGPEYFKDRGTGISIPLWGNDVIAPAGTWYEIAVLDGNQNVVQCAAYQFTGSGTVDLSTAPPYNPAPLPPSPLIPILSNPPGRATQTIHGNLIIDGTLTVTGAVIPVAGWTSATSSGGVLNLDLSTALYFAIALHENVTAVNFNNRLPSQDVTIYWVQNGTGNWTVAFQGDVLTPLQPNTDPNSRTLQKLTVLPDSNMMSQGYYP